jgi:Flp pilus assembly protein TadG
MSGMRARRGSAMLEFVLVGVPLIFVWISIVEMSIAMWYNHTLAYAVKMAGTYASVHGAKYLAASGTTGLLKNTATVLRDNAAGMLPSTITVTFKSISGTDHSTVLATYSCVLSACVADTATVWPSSSYNSAGAEFEIVATYTSVGVYGMITPGGSVGMRALPAFPAYTHATILF